VTHTERTIVKTNSASTVRYKLFRVLLPAALLVALMAFSSGAQGAVKHSYCGSLLPPTGTCNGGAHLDLQGNVALYPGTESTLTVCQQVYDNTLAKYVSASCGVNGTGSASNVIGYLGHSLTPYVQNGSSVNWNTVNGLWYSP
jgi:hypothetical protein